MNEVLMWIIFLAVGAVSIFALQFIKPYENSEEKGATDQIKEGETIYQGWFDKVRPDLRNRPYDGTFWSRKYTPVWLIKKRKKEEKHKQEERDE